MEYLNNVYSDEKAAYDIGKVKDKEISMEEVAELAGTINYEFACGITKRVSRRYLSKGKVVYIKEYC